MAVICTGDQERIGQSRHGWIGCMRPSSSGSGRRFPSRTGANGPGRSTFFLSARATETTGARIMCCRGIVPGQRAETRSGPTGRRPIRTETEMRLDPPWWIKETAFPQVRRGGQGRGRTADLPIFSHAEDCRRMPGGAGRCRSRPASGAGCRLMTRSRASVVGR